VALSVPAGLGLWLAAPRSPALAEAQAFAEVAAAAEALRGLQRRWPELEAGGAAAAGEAVLQALSGSAESTFEVTVPAGASLGVEIEGLAVTSVFDRTYGWQVGDKIMQINGADVESKDQAVKRVKEAREANSAIRVSALRLAQTPFVQLDRSLRLVYQDTDAAVPEPEDVSKKVGNLRSTAALVPDGVYSLAELRASLDTLLADLAAYTAEPKAPSAAKKVAKSASGGDDFGDLFR